MSDVPADIRKVADALWVRALNDGTPDAAAMIAEALMAERVQCARIAEGFPAFGNRAIANAILAPPPTVKGQ